MKTKLLTLLTLLVLCVTGAWADTELFSTDFSTWTSESITAGTTKNGIYFKSNSTITNGTGWVFSGNASTSANFIVIPLSGISGKITVTVTFPSSRPQFKCSVQESDTEITSWSGNAPSVSDYPSSRPSSNTTTLTFDITVNKSYAALCIGKGSNGATSLKSISITTPALTKATDPTFSPDGGDVDGNSTVTLSSDGTVYYQWSDTEADLTTASEGWTEGSSVKVPNVDGTKYLYAYATNGTGYESNVVHKSFNITAVTSSDVSFTWAFNTASPSTTPTYTPSDASDNFKNEAVTLGSNLAYANATQDLKLSGSATGDKSCKITISASGSETSEENALIFKVTPKTGVTFTPTNVSFRATRCGTDGGAMKIWWYDANDDNTLLGSAAASKTGDGVTDPARDNNSTQNWTVYDYDLTDAGVSATTGEFGLKIIIYNTSSKQYAFSNILIEGTYSGSPSDVTTYDIAVSVADGQSSYGTVSPSGTSTIDEGDGLEITATANTGYRFTKWVIDDEDVTINPYTFENVTAAHTAVAHFEVMPAISFGVGTSGATGTVPSTVYVVTGESFTIPANNSLYVSGKTLKAWNDGTSNHAIGETISNITANIALTPVFEDNAFDLDEIPETTVSFPFALNGGAPVMAAEGSSHPTTMSISQATVGSDFVDVLMSVDATNGKFNNNQGDATRCQVNATTTITLPAVSGMTVTIDKEFSTSYLGEDTNTGTTESGSTTWTYTGSAENVTLTIDESNKYPTLMTVVYPAMTVAITKLADRTYGTYVATNNLDFTDVENMEAYIATGLDGSVTIEKVTKVPAGAAIIVKTADKSVTSVNVPVAASADALTTNLLVAGDGVTAWDGTANTTYYFLKQDQFHQATSGTLQSGKAYLAIDSSLAKEMTISIGGDDDMTTTIDNLTISQFDKNATRYNLAGQKVSDSYKGIVIVNGKKYINK